MKRFIYMLILFISLIGCSGSENQTLKDITGIYLENIINIGIGYGVMSHLEPIQENDIEKFYNKINCKYKKSEKEVKEKTNEIYDRKHFVITTVDNESIMFFYTNKKIMFLYDGETYITSKSILFLESYWYLKYNPVTG